MKYSKYVSRKYVLYLFAIILCLPKKYNKKWTLLTLLYPRSALYNSGEFHTTPIIDKVKMNLLWTCYLLDLLYFSLFIANQLILSCFHSFCIDRFESKMKIVMKFCLIFILLVLFIYQSWKTIIKYRAGKTSLQVNYLVTDV